MVRVLPVGNCKRHHLTNTEDYTSLRCSGFRRIFGYASIVRIETALKFLAEHPRLFQPTCFGLAGHPDSFFDRGSARYFVESGAREKIECFKMVLVGGLAHKLESLRLIFLDMRAKKIKLAKEVAGGGRFIGGAL